MIETIGYIEIPKPTACCGNPPTLRVVEFSIAFACRTCSRMGEPAVTERSAVRKWNAYLDAAAPASQGSTGVVRLAEDFAAGSSDEA